MVIFIIIFFTFLFLHNPNSTFAQYLPQITSIDLNSGQNISLIENSTTSVSWSATVSHQDGYASISSYSGKLYRSGIANGNSCTPDNYNCYQSSSCSLSNCAGTTCTLSCSANLQYYADATDATSQYASESWLAALTAIDVSSNSTTEISSPDLVDINSLSAINPDSSVSFSTMSVNSDTGSSGQSVSLQNSGNRDVDLSFSSSDFCLDYPTCSTQAGRIPIENLRYGTSPDFSLGTTMTSTPTNYSSVSRLASTSLYFGLQIPTAKTPGTYSTTVTVDASINSLRPDGAQCSQNSDCQNNSCLAFYRDYDLDALGGVTSVSFCSTGTPPWGYVATSTDLDDSTYCPNLAYNPGTCQKCSQGSVVIQTSAEDLFGQCSTASATCASTCTLSAPTGNCSGSTASCDTNGDTSFVAAGKVCSGGSQVDATSQALSCNNSVNNVCSAGSCGGYQQFAECNGAGACDTSYTSNYQQQDIVASAGNVLDISCNQSASACASGATCQNDSFCDGVASTCPALTNKLDGELDNRCTTTNCSSFIWGLDPDLCFRAQSSSLNGACDGSGSCYSNFTDVCQSGTDLVTEAICGLGCVNYTACIQGTAATLVNACYIDDLKHGCDIGYTCLDTGFCHINEIPPSPTGSEM